MERRKTTDAQLRLRRKSIGATSLFNRRSSFDCEMQSQESPSPSGEERTKLMKRLRNKSWACGSTRRSSVHAEKGTLTVFKSRDRRPSHCSRSSNGYQFEGHKQLPWDMKTIVPRRWLKEYDKKQVSFIHLIIFEAR